MCTERKRGDRFGSAAVPTYHRHICTLLSAIFIALFAAFCGAFCGSFFVANFPFFIAENGKIGAIDFQL